MKEKVGRDVPNGVRDVGSGAATNNAHHTALVLILGSALDVAIDLMQDSFRDISAWCSEVDRDQCNGTRDREIRFQHDIFSIYVDPIDNDRPSGSVFGVHADLGLIKHTVKAVLKVANGDGAALDVLAVLRSGEVEADIVVLVVTFSKDVAEERESPGCVLALLLF